MLALSIAIAPATAFAQAGTSADPYEGENPQIQEQIDQAGPADEGGADEGPTPVAAKTQAADEGRELPFTGLDLALVIGAGALLLGLGLGMRRLTRPSGEAV